MKIINNAKYFIIGRYFIILNVSCPFGVIYNLKELELEKSGESKLDFFLSCGFQELTVLVQLGGHGHVTELVTDGHHHTTNNSRVNLN